jgi:ATP/maltotriose-dependent transcriptional regulator MalT
VRARGAPADQPQIAQTLFVIEETVELHLTNAYRTLGICSRFQLARPRPVDSAQALLSPQPLRGGVRAS